MTIGKKVLLASGAGAAILAAGALSGYASLVGAAATTTGTTTAMRMHRGPFGEKGEKGFGRIGMHGVFGKVTAVNGTTVTVTGMGGKTFTINAGSAKVEKVVAGSVSDISVGDSIGVEGDVSGDSVNATHIMDGIPQMK